MIHVMVDLETLGRRAGCKVLSIGAVVFGPKGLGAEFYMEVQRDHQPNLHEDQDTVDWWAKQSPEARERLFSNVGKVPLKHALEAFNDWLEKLTDRDAKGNLNACVWGNGADFDNAILNVAYAEVCVEAPAWPFWNNRCYRTLKGMKPSVKLVRTGVYHNALDDAKSQAEHAVRLMTELQAWEA